jgi:putative nucleotidyltransferase with HDIG domain
MKEGIKVSLFDMIMSIPGVIDLMSPELEGHHRRVACIAMNIAEEMRLSNESRRTLFLASLLHDCGALSLRERLDVMRFEAEGKDAGCHAEMGYRLLRTFTFLEKAAQVVRYHHYPWSRYKPMVKNDLKIPVESFILHLADRVDILSAGQTDAVPRTEELRTLVEKGSGSRFMPEAVDAFLKLLKSPSFWTKVANATRKDLERHQFSDIELGLPELLGAAKLIEKIIDFRSRFTATHSSGVSAVAEELAKTTGLSENECCMVKIAGYLHDLGKLAIPAEIIEKPGKLTEREYGVIRNHTYHSYRILKNVKGLEEINRIASFHHERLNGKGYPFGLSGNELSPGARIMCVADVFTAITEDRPYRKGMDSKSALNVLFNMAERDDVDSEIVSSLRDNYDRINNVRIEAQLSAIKEYQEFLVSIS